jgi:hypothetical protein
MAAPDPLPWEDHQKCGSGQHERCCRYLIFDYEGFHCGRDHRAAVLAEIVLRFSAGRPMRLLRAPTEPYPRCQL